MKKIKKFLLTIMLLFITTSCQDKAVDAIIDTADIAGEMTGDLPESSKISNNDPRFILYEKGELSRYTRYKIFADKETKEKWLFIIKYGELRNVSDVVKLEGDLYKGETNVDKDKRTFEEKEYNIIQKENNSDQLSYKIFKNTKSNKEWVLFRNNGFEEFKPIN